ncbi:DUF362 domain-containing protein [Methanocella arvoryzae]|uniref:DUF362 domain-containing protein n=1 Tax=Methanocella arvoryzae (strain DSM 22066 / NBRC 105507 / MRE50) TaxID=351160 RepID=Q0W1A9_METAR|nr:DUF362 domain-containing protein [Methanocella arvoryzae]CAJ37834.1 hypothetical protein RRC51 [Methanocella arvoryzae MRE50]
MKFDVVAVSLDSGSLGATAYDNTMQALKTLEADGQLDKLKLSGTVMIKPNFTQPPNPSLKFGPRNSDLTIHNHVCTDPYTIKAACDFVIDHGGKALICEGTKWPGGTRGVYLQTGCEPLLEGSKAVLFDTSTESPAQRVKIRPARVWLEDFAEMDVHEVFSQVDVILNLAKLKCHSNALITGAVKNMYGSLEPSQRRAEGHFCADPLWTRISRRRMAEGYKKLCETFVQVHSGILNTFGMDEICVIEGVISGEGDGPLFQPATPRQENVVLASVNNPATIDAAESYYVGYSPEFLRNFAQYALHEMNFAADDELLDSYGEQYFLKLAEESGMGRTRDFSAYVISPQASEIMPGHMLGLMRRGDVFALPTFVRHAANTPLYDRVPEPDYEFKVEVTA